MSYNLPVFYLFICTHLKLGEIWKFHAVYKFWIYVSEKIGYDFGYEAACKYTCAFTVLRELWNYTFKMLWIFVTKIIVSILYLLDHA